MGAMPPASPSSHRAMNYPLNLSFKIVAIAPQIYVSDAQGSPVCFVKQKLFKLKEDIIVFSDSSKSRQIANIKSNKILDWSARYFFTDPQGGEIGSIGRRGFKSIWRASYDVFNPGDDSPTSVFTKKTLGPKSSTVSSVTFQSLDFSVATFFTPPTPPPALMALRSCVCKNNLPSSRVSSLSKNSQTSLPKKNSIWFIPS